MTLFIISFVVSFIACLLCLKISFKYGFCIDAIEGIQKIHSKPTPRIGGIPLLAGFGAGLLYLSITKGDLITEFLLFLGSSLPVFLAGLWEDATRRISPRIRLAFAILSAILAIFLLDLRIMRIDIPGIDYLFLKIPLTGILLAIIGIAGLVNAINIIDGLNGLASGVSLIILSSIAYMSFHLGDEGVFKLSLVLISITTAFFLYNYPAGFVFLGDGGAYFLGFGIGVLSIMLVNRNPQVSPWFPMVLVVYPVWETLFSMWRRKIKKRMTTEPDNLHLHSLLYKRLIKWILGNQVKGTKNIFAAPMLWSLEIFLSILATLFYSNTPVLVFLTFGFIFLYTKVYFAIARFKIGQGKNIKKL